MAFERVATPERKARHQLRDLVQVIFMFSEELGSNASRKRAEAAKLRRKKIKQEQLRKASAAASKTNGDVPKNVVPSVPPTTSVASVAPATQANTKLAVLERAREQRERRALTAAQLKATTKIQALLRGWYNRSTHQRNVNSQILSKLNDMDTVKSMLRSQGKEFVPPRATASSVLGLLLMVDRPTPSMVRDSLRLCLLPGLLLDGKNPVSGWPDRRVARLVSEVLDWAVSVAITNNEEEEVSTLLEPLYKSPLVSPHLNLLSKLGEALLLRVPTTKALKRRHATKLCLLACIHEGRETKSLCQLIFSTPLLTWRVDPDVTMIGLFQRVLHEFHEGWMDDDDKELVRCGSTRSQRLLANLQCLGRSAPTLQTLPAYWKVASTLVEIVPVGTFSTTETPVAWIDGQKPVVLNGLILEHCHWLLVDSHIRKSIAAVPSGHLVPPDSVDREREADVKAMTAAALAKEEANKIDRSAIWSSSKWARKLVERLRLPSPPKQDGETLSDVVDTKASSMNKADSKELFFAVARTLSILVARWGGDAVDVVQGEVRKLQDPRVKSLLNVLGFSTSFLPVAWSFLQSIKLDTSLPIRSRTANDQTMAVLYLFLCTFSHVLIVTDDAELHDFQKPLPLHHVRRCIVLLKDILFQAICTDPDGSGEGYFGLALVTAASRTMRDLYDRSSRRPICVPKLWVQEDLLQAELGQCKSYDDYQSLLSRSAVLRVCPYLVPFKRRLKLFERIITTNRVRIQGENSPNPFHTNPLKPGIPIRITRGRLLEDGLRTMNNLGSNMRQRLAVQYFNEAGTRETGIDVGGLFKEFWTDLCAIAFDPNYALFRVTENSAGFGNALYPSPASFAAHGAEHITLFSFLGRILGKALYEGITIHPVFSHFTLSFLRGDYNFLHMLADLSTIDPQLYNNLMFLKTYDGDAADLALTFTVTSDDFGGTKEVPLIPNGAKMDVTNSNKHLYIGLVAKYYVYDRMREQSEAMVRGLFEVIDRSWLRLFNEPELQILISGASDGKIDVDDLKANVNYTGGYSSLDPNIRRFWSVVVSLNQKQQASLLRFVTSCERPPPLGFKSLNPPFTIQRAGFFPDGKRLPTASTCFNTLKLPTYTNERVLRERLLYAVDAGAGFELS